MFYYLERQVDVEPRKSFICTTPERTNNTGNQHQHKVR